MYIREHITLVCPTLYFCRPQFYSPPSSNLQENSLHWHSKFQICLRSNFLCNCFTWNSEFLQTFFHLSTSHLLVQLQHSDSISSGTFFGSIFSTMGLVLPESKPNCLFIASLFVERSVGGRGLGNETTTISSFNNNLCKDS